MDMTLMFTRQPNTTNNPGFTGIVQEDFYVSHFENKAWQNAYNAGAPLNTIRMKELRLFPLTEVICFLLPVTGRAEWETVIYIFQLSTMANGQNQQIWAFR